MLQRPSYEMSVTAMAPSQFEFETPGVQETSKYLRLRVKEGGNTYLIIYDSVLQRKVIHHTF